MTRALLFFAVSACLSLLATACDDSRCSKVCEIQVDCPVARAKERFPSCEWKRGTDAVREECEAACEKAYSELSPSEQDDVASCWDCFEAERHGACELDELVAARVDCASDCQIDSIVEYDRRFVEAYDSPELTCE